MAMTLLAHAYAKSGQRYKALSTIQSDIFGQCGAAVFPELQLEVQYAAAREISTASGTSQQQALASQQAQAASAKKPIATSAAAKNKGKKKVHTQPQQTQPAASSTLSTVVPKAWDLIDQLDWTPTLPADWEQCLPPRNATFQPDVTLLATLSMTMLSILKLPLTAYQLYCWAATATTASSDDVALFTRQAYLNGLAVLIAPQYANIQASILSNMQVLALQVARYQPTALLWAAQTALWQLTFPVVVPPAKTNTTDRNNNDKDDGDAEKHAQRLAMLPRLAESLASKCVAHYCDSLSSSDCKSLANTTTATNSDDASTESNNSSSLLSTESFLLYIRTLDWQSKWTEMLDALEERLRTDTAGKQMSPPRQTILELKVQALLKMENRSTAIRETVEVLLTMYPDDWEYWKQHLQSSIAESDGDVERGCVVTEEFVAKILQIQSSRFLSRGPSLMQVELAATRMKNTVTSGAAISALMESIIRYGNDFSSCASCIFSDLCPYLEVFTASCSADQANALLKWSKELRNVEPASDDPKKRRNQLQVYIFAVQVNYKVLVKFTELWGDELPSWEELVQVWKSFQTFENMEKVDQVCGLDQGTRGLRRGGLFLSASFHLPLFTTYSANYRLKKKAALLTN